MITSVFLINNKRRLKGSKKQQSLSQAGDGLDHFWAAAAVVILQLKWNSNVVGVVIFKWVILGWRPFPLKEKARRRRRAESAEFWLEVVTIRVVLISKCQSPRWIELWKWHLCLKSAIFISCHGKYLMREQQRHEWLLVGKNTSTRIKHFSKLENYKHKTLLAKSASDWTRKNPSCNPCCS